MCRDTLTDPVMNSGLSIFQIALLAGYAVGMACGQLLFKTAALQFAGEAPLVGRLLSLLQNGFFLSAIALYGALSVLWVWVLTFTPLSQGYPFVAIAFALTPVLGGLVFAEPLSVRLLIGLAVIIGGLYLVAG
jgi:drug/metabolite transporter (DMT)-like permease